MYNLWLWACLLKKKLPEAKPITMGMSNNVWRGRRTCQLRALRCWFHRAGAGMSPDLPDTRRCSWRRLNKTFSLCLQSGHWALPCLINAPILAIVCATDQSTSLIPQNRWSESQFEILGASGSQIMLQVVFWRKSECFKLVPLIQARREQFGRRRQWDPSEQKSCHMSHHVENVVIWSKEKKNIRVNKTVKIYCQVFQKLLLWTKFQWWDYDQFITGP